MGPTRSRVGLFGLLALLACAAALPARGPARAPDDSVRVLIVSVLANDRNDHVDEKIACIAREVRKQKQGEHLTGFRYAKMSRATVKLKRWEEVDLAEDQVAAVFVKHAADEQNKVCLKVKAPQLGELTYRTCCGKFFPLITGYQNKKNDVLIIAVMVEPCPKDKKADK